MEKIDDILKRIIADIIPKIIYPGKGKKFWIATRHEGLKNKLFAMTQTGETDKVVQHLSLMWREGLRASNDRIRAAVEQCESDREGIEQLLLQMNDEIKEFEATHAADFTNINEMFDREKVAARKR